jgi:hypothetical protein
MPCKITLTNIDLLQQAKFRYEMAPLVQSAIQAKIILTGAEKQGVVIAAADLQAAADAMRVKHRLLSAKDTLNWLNQQHLSVTDFEELAYAELLRDRLARILFDDQIEAHFADRQLDYQRAIIYQLMLTSQELAMELFYAWQERETDFLSLLHQYGTTTGHDYKVHQTLRRRDFPPELSAPIFAATPPTLLRPIHTERGSFLVYVAELIAAKLDDYTRSNIREELFQQWLQKQQKEAEIVLPSELSPLKQ